MNDTSIQTRVQNQYERYPYPGYPLYTPLKWQDGYPAASWFSKKLLFENLKQATPPTRRVLILGCGDTQPYIFHKLEQPHTQIKGIDLAQSHIKRAGERFIFGTPSRLNLLQASVEEHLPHIKASYCDHIDAFGVLHHLADPEATIKQCHRILSPNGTMRIMVYNSHARRWIHSIAKLAKLSQCDYMQGLDAFWQLISILQKNLPHLSDKIATVLANRKRPARIVDAFFHEHEAIAGFSTWFDLFAQNGLKAYALFDRHLELLDLPNPLWQLPLLEQLEARVQSGAFKNHLELYLYKPAKISNVHSAPHPFHSQFIGKKRLSALYQAFPQPMQFYQRLLAWQHSQYGAPLDWKLWKHKKYHLPLKKLAHLGLLHRDQLPMHLEEKMLAATPNFKAKSSQRHNFAKEKNKFALQTLNSWQNWMQTRGLLIGKDLCEQVSKEIMQLHGS